MLKRIRLLAIIRLFLFAFVMVSYERGESGTGGGIGRTRSNYQMWQKTYGGRGWDEDHAIQQTSEGGYIVAGGTASSGAGEDDVG